MNTAQSPVYLQSKGGGQFFKIVGDDVIIVCVYAFNPLVERTRMRAETLAKLSCDPCAASEFAVAYNKALSLITDDSHSPSSATSIQENPVNESFVAA